MNMFGIEEHARTNENFHIVANIVLTRWDVFRNSDPLPSYPNFDISLGQIRFLLGLV